MVSLFINENSVFVWLILDFGRRMINVFTGGSRNFRTGGAVEFVGSGDCFDASLINTLFLSQEEIKAKAIYIVY